MRLFGMLAALAPFATAQLQTQLNVTGPPPGEPVTLILTRWNGADCSGSGLQRIALPADGKLTLPAGRGDACWQNDPLAGLAVLARDRAVAYLRAAEFDGRDEPVVVEMRPRRIVNIVVHPASARMELLARDDLAHTDWIWNRNLAGLTIRARFLPPNAAVENAHCEKLLDFVPGEINLYYGAQGQNLSCGFNSAVFVHDVPVLGDAAHELSHRLGLNQLDHSREASFDNGHTTNQEKAGFGCNNVMWTLTDVLQDQLSPGQAFWMGLACSSFTAHHGPCLACAEVAGDPSPCPSFAVGQEFSGAVCDACDLPELKLIVGEVDTQGRNQFCDRDSLRKALAARFRDLQQNNGLKPVSRNEREFVERWLAEIQTVLKVESVARLMEQQDRDRGQALLFELAEKAPREWQRYLRYAADAIRKNPGYRPRCEQGMAPPRK